MSPANPTDDRRTEVWQGRDGLWRWRYVDPSAGEDGQPLELTGNKHFSSRTQAMDSALTAYPNVGVLDRDGSVNAQPAERRRRRRLRRLAWRTAWIGFLVWLLIIRRWQRANREIKATDEPQHPPLHLLL